VEPALRWLEEQPPPEIRACRITERSAYRIAVPNNDMDVVASEWARGKPGDPAKLRTMKEIRPKELPLEGPHVQYIWRVEESAGEAMAGGLRTAARCIHTLGWGVDMAFADVTEPAALAETWEPAAAGERFAVPMPGTLNDLRSAYRRFTARAADARGVDTHTRPSLLRMQPYRRAGELVRPDPVRFVLFNPAGEERTAVPWEDCMKVAGWLRHAAAKRLASEFDAPFIEQYIQGHTKPDEKARRLSYVPVPSIFGKYGDGRIRRAFIVEPGDAEPADTEPPNASGEVSRKLRLKLTGRVLTDREGNEVCSLAAPPVDDWTFRQYLQSKAQIWRTVTPLVLHGFNADRRGSISVDKTERLLLRAFEMAGYDERSIESFAFQSAPWFPGTKHAAAMRVPAHLKGFPRVHVEVRFRHPIPGPVLAGIGRHYGIGLFAVVHS
jgi:CRISPR-associated protein Csb2